MAYNFLDYLLGRQPTQEDRDAGYFGDTVAKFGNDELAAAQYLLENAGTVAADSLPEEMGVYRNVLSYPADLVNAALLGAVGGSQKAVAGISELFADDAQDEKRLARDILGGLEVVGVSPQSRAVSLLTAPAKTAVAARAPHLLSDVKYAARSVAEGDLEGVKDALYQGGVADSVGAASNNIFEDIYNPDVNKVNKEVLDPAQLSKQKLPDYVGNIQYEVTPTGNLVAKETVDIADLKDKTLVPAFGDRTYGGGLLTNIGGVDLDQPVIMQGGHDFMRDVDTGLWASEKDAMLKKARFIDQLIAQGEDPVLVYTAMGGQSGDFSHHMSNAVMGLVEQSKITKKAAKSYDDKIRETVDPNWVGILHPNVRDYLQNNMTGTDRRLLWQEMDKKMYTDQGFPHVGVARAAITDPDLLTVDPFTSGLSLGQPTGGGLLVSPTKEHFSYSSQIDGPYLGGLEEQVSGDLIWRDFFEGRRNANIPSSGDQRSFMMSPYISQKVDNQMIDQVSSLIEYLRRVGQN